MTISIISSYLSTGGRLHDKFSIASPSTSRTNHHVFFRLVIVSGLCHRVLGNSSVLVLQEDHIPYGPVIVATTALILGFLFTVWVVLEAFFCSQKARRRRVKRLTNLHPQAKSFLGDLEMYAESEVLVSWHNVCCAYATPMAGKREPEITMALQQASGEMRSGQLTAIMGGRYVHVCGYAYMNASFYCLSRCHCLHPRVHLLERLYITCIFLKHSILTILLH
jgi:hypothetical protein